MTDTTEYGKRAGAYEVSQPDIFPPLYSDLNQDPAPHTVGQRKKPVLGGEHHKEGFGQIINPGSLVWSSIGAPVQVLRGYPRASVSSNDFIEKHKHAPETFREVSADYVSSLRPQSRLSGPVKFVQSLLKTWRLKQDDAVLLLGFEDSDRDHVNNLLNGHAPLLGRDVKDRVAYLLQIRKTLSALFLNEEVENEWLREKHAMLNNIAPMELMLEGTMENLLLVKEYVDTAAGK